ncbi:Vacuolar processing enzyme 1 [Zostera marina]|uniref:Vacuolar processing enzyme 1 n=1 Tax=Zostera marina TaxID=29655 RepID=A0A0K9NZT6_ZOSMR|nr:Vacuolar processing enzyme 1 [Zostera marina]
MGMPTAIFFSLLICLTLIETSAYHLPSFSSSLRLPSDRHRRPRPTSITWAVLVAGSSGFGNYRHQADVCHAYQILRSGGVKEENIIVFMYDDIATNPLNPRPGTLINHPDGGDVYAGVPKDYTGESANVWNLYNVLLGNATGTSGGSGKVVDSKPNDRIFLFYSDHGGPGVLGMPAGPFLYAGDFVSVLRTKHQMGTYSEMLIYLEACESGSIFEGMIGKEEEEELEIYVTTASNAIYIVKIVAWMEDSESNDLKSETVREQYHQVKDRTSNYNTFAVGSHVMQYGTRKIKSDTLSVFHGFNPRNANVTSRTDRNRVIRDTGENQRDAEVLFLWRRYERMDERSPEREEVMREITDKMAERVHVDRSVRSIGRFLLELTNRDFNAEHIRPVGEAVVDDWGCLKKMVGVFENYCGLLGQYGMRHMRVFANICNHGLNVATVEEACHRSCVHDGEWRRWFSL